MGLSKLLALPATGPIRLVTWIAENVAAQAYQELYSEEAVRGRLMELELRYDLGELGKDEYDQAEEELLELLEAARRGAS